MQAHSVEKRSGSEREWSNWSGRLRCSPRQWSAPGDLATLQESVRQAERVRTVGSGHSFTELVPTSQTLIDTSAFSGVRTVDRERRTARVGAGTTLADLGPLLAAEGLALANQGDIDRQTLAGAVSTATHGTGVALGCIASRVCGLQMVTAGGDVLEISARYNADWLEAAPVTLGALGVLTEIEIECEPRYSLRERVWCAPLAEVLDEWETLRDEHRHFEFFAFPFTGRAMAKTLSREAFAPVPRAAMDAHAADASGGGFAQLLELNRSDPEAARQAFAGALAKVEPTEDFGPSHVIFPSERTDRFNEMEYAVPLESGIECLREVLAAIEAADLPVLFPIEFRTVAADELWLSPFYRRSSAVLAVHQDAALDFRPVFEVTEPILRRHGGRPHWGKIHTVGGGALGEHYPRWHDFQSLRRELDPGGKFLNPYLADLFGEVA